VTAFLTFYETINIKRSAFFINKNFFGVGLRQSASKIFLREKLWD